MSRLEVFSLDSHNLRQSLIEVIGPQLEDGQGALSSASYMPLTNTIEHIVGLGAKVAIVQHQVQDPDFIAEHEAYYYKWTTPVKRFCKRIHFFRKEITGNESPLKIIDQFAEESGVYLGFITLRPIRLCPLGATILLPNSYPDQDRFIIARESFQVNLTGASFSVLGTPFMQQDNAVGACAQASIWMGLRTLRKRLGQSAFSPAQITNAATRFLVKGRTLPNRQGLVVDQITEALRSSGYAPHVIPLRSGKEVSDGDVLAMKARLYPYVESGIPVLLGLFPPSGDGHAVLLIGHDWDADPSSHYCLNYLGGIVGKPVKLVCASSWVNHFYIHNDNTGPYVPLPDRGREYGYCLEDAAFAIPFLRKDVLMDADEAITACYGIFANCIDDSLVKSLPPFVFRVYLQERSEFRRCVREGDLPEEIQGYYREKWLPKRVWVAEINVLNGYGSLSHKKSRVGEVVLDPYSDPYDGHFLSIRLSSAVFTGPTGKGVGVIVDRDPFDGKIKFLPFSDAKCTALIR
ncbi:hypothetical protein MWU49_11490 [Alcanivorax sp. S6407]|uniref:hypothetical protein n=1 Tax=Alcanivorax sp. S6407 TaxID=2926424 RepID=UPI001FF2AB9B|nr:hypothetical protein [Alcanivorax sp. S6407]MCK0154328.1 hypothetical protein [Alcanivorax sp. S6407]